jgi:hypothetical protein
VKKAKILIAVLVCSLMLMGVGYALWNQTLVMATTAKTGSMDVMFTSNTAIEEKSNAVEASVGKKQGGRTAYSENDVNVNTETADLSFWPPQNPTYYYDEAQCTLSNLYPGAEVKVKVCVKNKGSIPVKFDGVSIADLPDWLKYEVEGINTDTEIGTSRSNDTKTFFITFSVPEEETGHQGDEASFNVNINWVQYTPQQ